MLLSPVTAWLLVTLLAPDPLLAFHARSHRGAEAVSAPRLRHHDHSFFRLLRKRQASTTPLPPTATELFAGDSTPTENAQPMANVAVTAVTTADHGTEHARPAEDGSAAGHAVVAGCTEEKEMHGVQVANLRWDFVSVPFVFTVFVILAGLTKLIFHHANFLSSIVPESCMLILLGTIVGGISHATHSDYVPTFSADTFFLFLLPPIILESAYSLHDSAFFSNIGTILLFAVLGTIINVFTIGPTLYFLNSAGAIGYLDLNLLECLVFSSLISAVDPVAVLAIFQEVGVNKSLYFLVFGESLLNDAVTVVLYNMMVGFFGSEVTAREVGIGIAALLSVSFGAIGIGCAMGMLTAIVTKYTSEVRVVEPLAVLGIAYLSYLTAELVHFSGIISIICCGLLQVQYAMGNISRKSYTTVKYFTKMLSAVSDTIIFIFLGIVLVNKQHVWNTGFVIWSTALCLIYRFITVFGLTYLVNTFGRVRKINLEEQFIMAYGGLRGAVAFSLVIMLSSCKFSNYEVLITATLFIVLFTVFIQGASVKPLVNLLKIRLHQSGDDKLITEINSKLLDNIMLGIEEVTGHRGGNYWKQVLEQMDEKYLKPYLQHKSVQDNLTRVYTKIVLADHYAHLYGPAAALEENIPLKIQKSFDEGVLGAMAEEQLVEEAGEEEEEEEEGVEGEDRGLLFHPHLDRKNSVAREQPAPRRVRFTRFADQVRAASQSADLAPEKRRHTVGAMFSRSFHQDSLEEEDPTKLLVKAFNENPYHKYHQRYNRNLIGDDNQELEAHLRARRLRAHRLTLATMASEMSSAEMSMEGSRSNLAVPGMATTPVQPDRLAPVAASDGLADRRSSIQLRRNSVVRQSAYTWLNFAHRRHSMLRKQKSGSADSRNRPSLKLERQSAVTDDVSDDNAEHGKGDENPAQMALREDSQSLQLATSVRVQVDPEERTSVKLDEKTKETAM